MPSLVAAWAIAVSAIAPFWSVLSTYSNTSSCAGRRRAAPRLGAAVALTSAPHGRAPLRAARDRAQVAGDLGAGAHLGSSQRRRWGAALVRARDAALPERRAAH